MALEKKWEAIAPRTLVENGGLEGQLTLSSSRDFKVGMTVALSASNQDTINLIVLKVPSDKIIWVGNEQGKPTDVSAYTTAFSAAVSALEQKRIGPTLQERENAVYAEEPTVAKRVLNVDEFGKSYNSDNPLPVDILPNANVKNFYDEVASVPTGTPVSVSTYTVPVGAKAWLLRVEATGGNVATYEVFVNGEKVAKRRTYFGADLTTEFEFASAPAGKGIPLQAGDVVLLRATHQRPDVCDFEGRIQVLELESA